MSINAAIHPAYFQTRFRQDTPISDWPVEFAIITAHATTGESWTTDENEIADRSLAAELRESCRWMQRLTGYSPTTGHAEAGWAVELPWDKACEIGLRYKQDAIYAVTGDELCVTLCDHRRGLVLVGAFRERVSSEFRTAPPN